MPEADIMGVFPFALGTFGMVGLACIPIGVDMAGKVVVISAAAGTAIFATQRARRPEWVGFSQDTVVLSVGVVRGGVGWRGRAQAQTSGEIDAARLRAGDDRRWDFRW